MVLDIFKAYFAVKLSMYLFPKLLLAGVISAASVILGHIFPFYMGFRGGKGFASLGGSILALDYRIFFVLLIVTVCIVFISDYVCLGPTIISTVFAVGFGYIRNSLAVTLILLVPSICIWIRHMENFKRMKNGQELRFSFLWNRKSEAERLGIKDDDGESYPFSYDEGKFGE